MSEKRTSPDSVMARATALIPAAKVKKKWRLSEMSSRALAGNSLDTTQ